MERANPVPCGTDARPTAKDATGRHGGRLRLRLLCGCDVVWVRRRARQRRPCAQGMRTDGRHPTDERRERLRAVEPTWLLPPRKRHRFRICPLPEGPSGSNPHRAQAIPLRYARGHPDRSSRGKWQVNRELPSCLPQSPGTPTQLGYPARPVRRDGRSLGGWGLQGFLLGNRLGDPIDRPRRCVRLTRGPTRPGVQPTGLLHRSRATRTQARHPSRAM